MILLIISLKEIEPNIQMHIKQILSDASTTRECLGLVATSNRTVGGVDDEDTVWS